MAFPVAFGSTRERMSFIPGVPASIWLVCCDGHALFLSLSRPVLGEQQLEIIAAHCTEQLKRDLGSRQGIWRAEKVLRNCTGLAVALRNIPLDAEYDSPERLREYLLGRLFAGTKTNPALRGQVIEVLLARLLANMRAQVTTFQQALDTEIVLWMRQTGVRLDLENYNRWLNLAPADATYRRQAFRILPRLLRYLDDVALDISLPYAVPSPTWCSARDAGLILSAIDRGLPLFETLKHIFNLPEEVFRWLAKFEHAPQAESWPFDSRLLFHMLAQMAPEKRPASPEQWCCLRRMLEITFECRLPLRLAMAWVVEASRRGLEEMARKIANTPGYFNELAQSADFFKMLALCIQTTAHEMTGLVALSGIDQISDHLAAIIGKAGMRRLLAASARWHRLLAQAYEEIAAHHQIVTDADGDPALQTCWPALFDGEIELSAEVFAVCLHSTEELIREGQALDHCVGQFTYQCIHYGSHIVSLRSRASGKPLSTAELSLVEKKHGIEFEVRQHHEYHNRPATPLQEQLLLKLLLLLAREDNQEWMRQLYQLARIQTMRINDEVVVDQLTLELMEQALAPEWSLQQLAAQIFKHVDVDTDCATEVEIEPVIRDSGRLRRIRKRLAELFAAQPAESSPAMGHLR